MNKTLKTVKRENIYGRILSKLSKAVTRKVTSKALSKICYSVNFDTCMSYWKSLGSRAPDPLPPSVGLSILIDKLLNANQTLQTIVERWNSPKASHAEKQGLRQFHRFCLRATLRMRGKLVNIWRQALRLPFLVHLRSDLESFESWKDLITGFVIGFTKVVCQGVGGWAIRDHSHGWKIACPRYVTVSTLTLELL